MITCLEKLRRPVAKRMRAAYHADSALAAQALLEALAAELDKTHPGAAGSLREGMAETLTVFRLDLPPTLTRKWTVSGQATAPGGAQRSRESGVDVVQAAGSRVTR